MLMILENYLVVAIWVDLTTLADVYGNFTRVCVEADLKKNPNGETPNLG